MRQIAPLQSRDGGDRRRVRVLAIDYGEARTGLAISDPTGTLARPLETVEQAATETGLGRILEVATREQATRIVVGMPLTLKGERGAQARATEQFIADLQARTAIPIESFDERFTTRVAQRHAAPGQPDDPVAAAHLLTGFLTWLSGRRE